MARLDACTQTVGFADNDSLSGGCGEVGECPLAGAVCGFGGCLGTRGSLIINEAILLYCYSLAIKAVRLMH